MAGRPGRLRGRSVQTLVAYWLLIRAQGYTYPDVAWAISAVETGYWHPKAAIMRQHNLFAFKVNSRKNYVVVGTNGYVVFQSQAQCLVDYGAYEQQVITRYALRSRQAYIDHICRRFCPNPTYRGKLALAFQTLQAIT